MKYRQDSNEYGNSFGIILSGSDFIHEFIRLVSDDLILKLQLNCHAIEFLGVLGLFISEVLESEESTVHFQKLPLNNISFDGNCIKGR